MQGIRYVTAARRRAFIHPICVYCGRGPAQGMLLEADHVIPRAEGGPDTLANLVTACQDCNRGKSAKRVLTQEAS